MRVYNLRADDFDGVIELGCKINGANYLDYATCEKILGLSCKAGLNCSFVAYKGRREEKELIGFRLTYAPGQWEINDWCCPPLWKVDPTKVCYFKANMVAEEYRGQGLGTALLKLSIHVAKRQGAVAGVTHVWMQSPNRSAFGYFIKAGGQMLMLHPSRWNQDCTDFGYDCAVCGKDCHCDGAEMILYF